MIGHTAHAAARLLATWLVTETPETLERWHVEALHTARTGEVPCRFIELDEQRAHQLALADNRLSELSGWSVDLGAVLAEVDPQRERIDLLGWTTEQLDELLADLVSDSTPDEGQGNAVDEDPPEREPITRLGDRIEFDGGHVLYCIDSTSSEALTIARAAKPRLMVLDPPFDVLHENWAVPESVEAMYVWNRGFRAFPWMVKLGVGSSWGVHTLVFTGSTRGQIDQIFPCLVHEVVYVMRRAGVAPVIDRRAIGRIRGIRATVDGRHYSAQENWLTSGVTGEADMPWAKPSRCMEIGMAYVPPGSVVWDPCAGGGTSLIAAAKQGRRWVGCDVSPLWCDLIAERWEKQIKTPWRRIRAS